MFISTILVVSKPDCIDLHAHMQVHAYTARAAYLKLHGGICVILTLLGQTIVAVLNFMLVHHMEIDTILSVYLFNSDIPGS